MKKFRAAIDILDELDFIQQKIDFLGEAAVALACKTDTVCLGESAACGCLRVYNDLAEQCGELCQALRDDFGIFKKEPETPSKKTTDDFCAAVEKSIQGNREKPIRENAPKSI